MENTTPTSSEKQAAFFTHIAAFAGLIIPLGRLLGPFIAWQSKKNESEFVDKNDKASMNFQLSLLFWGFIILLLSFFNFFGLFELFASNEPVSTASSAGEFKPLQPNFNQMPFYFKLVPMYFISHILSAIFCIIAGLKAQNGKVYKYPLTISFIK